MTPDLDLSSWGALIVSALLVIVCPAVLDFLAQANASNMLKSKAAWWAAWIFATPTAVASQADMFDAATPADLAAWAATTLAAALVGAGTIRALIESAHAITKYSRARAWLAGMFGGIFGDNLADLERWARYDPLGFEKVAALTATERAELAALGTPQARPLKPAAPTLPLFGLREDMPL